MATTHILPNFTAAAAFGGLRARIEASFAAFRKQVAMRRTFQQTFDELNRLSDRDLADLDIARSDIARIARESVYGVQ